MAKLSQEQRNTLALRLEVHSKRVTDEHLDLNAYDEHGYTLLHYHTALGHEKEVDRLLQEPSININVKREHRNSALEITPLAFAATFEDLEEIGLKLIVKGASIEMVEIHKKMASWYYDYIKKSVEDYNRELVSIEEFDYKDSQKLKFHLKISAKIDYSDIYITCRKFGTVYSNFMQFYVDDFLRAAIDLNSIQVFKIILDSKLDALLPKNENITKNPVQYAVENDVWSIVKCAIEVYKFDKNYRNINGDSLLQIAAKSNAKECIVELLKYRINISNENYLGENFFHNIFSGGVKIEKYILSEIIKTYGIEEILKIIQKPNVRKQTPCDLLLKWHQELKREFYGHLEIEKISNKDFDSTDYSQTYLMNKLWRYQSIKNKTNEFSKSGYCVGYSILLQCMGRDKFKTILKNILAWDGSQESLQCTPQNADFKTLDDLLNYFTYRINFAQQYWITLTTELHLKNVLNGLGVAYTLIADEVKKTEQPSSIEEMLKKLIAQQQNTSLLLWGDGHSCNIKYYAADKRIEYNDPSLDSLTYDYNSAELKKLAEFIYNSKCKKNLTGSETRFIMFAICETSPYASNPNSFWTSSVNTGASIAYDEERQYLENPPFLNSKATYE